ncbi:hypothetical protein KVM82_03270 [Helicobacter pylori]|nr:hypothetical protein KVM82_03270 [Helicobacter pylori]
MAIRFGVIFIVDFLRAISVDDKNKQLRSILECKKKCNPIKFYELYSSIHNTPKVFEEVNPFEILGVLNSSITKITAFVVFTDESDAIFNLKNYLLVLSKNFNSGNIWYCENFVRNKEGTYNIEIELVSNGNDFGEVLDIVKDTSNKDIFNHNDLPHELPQFLANFKNSKIPNEKISFNFTSNKNSSISPYAAFNRKVRDTFDCYCWHGYSKIPQEKRIAKIQEQVNEEIKLDPSFCNHRVSSEQNRKINEIAEGLKSGKIIGEKIIANAFDLNAGYCFITPDDLKNLLKERLFIQQDIINAINQRKGVVLDHAQINDIQYNLLDNTFHFIFNVGNSLLKESSQLIIEVPREALDLENIDRLIKNTLSSHRVCFCSEIYSACSENSLICHLNQGSYIIDLHLIDD